MAKSKPRFGTFIIAAGIAFALWLMAHGQSDIERGVDIPVAFHDVPETLVVTGHSVDQVNIRVMGSRATLRNVSPSKLEYRIDVAGAKPGRAIYEVDVSRIELPRRTRIVSRSPSSIEVEFERRGRKAVRVRPDLEGDPPEGYVLGEVEVDPPRVWLVGARSDVLRLSEVVTEPVQLGGLTAPAEREVRLFLGGGHVWQEQSGPVTVRIQIDPIPEPEIAEGETGAEGDAGEERGGA